MKKELKIIGVGTILIVLLTIFLFPYTRISIASSDIEQRLENAVVLYIGSPYAYFNNTGTQIDPDNAEVIPIVKDETTLIPIKFVSESLGAAVNWEPETSTVTITLGEKLVTLVIGSDKMDVDGKKTELSVPVEAINNRTFVPLRAVAEAFEKHVFYERGLIIISDTKNIFNPETERLLVDKVISLVNKLPTVDSPENLKKLLKQSEQENNSNYKVRTGIGAIFDMADRIGDDLAVAETSSTQNAVKGIAPEAGASADYSTTNVQVQGVDEADVVKTDGKYIYQVNNKKIVIAQAYPANDMQIVGTIDFKEKDFSPQEMYIDEKHLVVIGTSSNFIPIDWLVDDGASKRIAPYSSSNTVKAIIYDITDKTQIENLREVELEGYYLSSRKIGDALYLIANRNIYRYGAKGEQILDTPSYRDTVVKDEFVAIDYPDIAYFPGCVYSNYMITAGINLGKLDEEVKTSTFLGSGQNVYASTENLYVAVTNQQVYRVMEPAPITIQPDSIAPAAGLRAVTKSIMPYYTYSNNTLIYKFALEDGTATYLCKGEVPGTILNQFSMDEHNRHFRIATTIHGTWTGNGSTESTNNLFVLDETMQIVGKIEDIAPGERIYSTRFMGDRGYMVTFKNVDPLFVMDLKDPKNPTILGALKIPGYSDYLHPYDENHIIGFGKDTVEVPVKTWDGNESGSMALYQGLKMAIFDVSDVTNPVQKFTEMIGDRGTDSELLSNHKALLFSKEKNLISFPVRLAEVKDKSPDPYTAAYQYGEFSFQGQYVYNIDLEKGFTLRGRVTHLTDEDYLKAGTYRYNHARNIERGLYINDVLYTLSKGMIKANNLNTLQEIKSVEIAQ